jgi:tricarballylate dehydrogenase
MSISSFGKRAKNYNPTSTNLFAANQRSTTMSSLHRLTADPVDVIVVGGGNAGFSAAHAAAERGRSVRLLEQGTAELAGGNSYFTAGATRIAHNGLDDLRDFIDPDERHGVTDVPPYSEEEYSADLAKLTDGKNDPDLTAVLVSEGQATLRWLHGLGLKYRLMYERQSYLLPDGTFQFWGGVHVGNTGGGEGLIRDHTRVAESLGIEVRYGHEATRLLFDDGKVVGVLVDTGDGGPQEMHAESIILAAGGFEANAELRRVYLGPGWENAKVRGTLFNQGRLLQTALECGAVPAGDWSTAHSVQWDAFAENNESNRGLTNRLTRQGYPLGILVNKEGKRFLDEGADFRNYTYAKYGKEVLQQPGSIAFQIFDSISRPMLKSEEYDMPGISKAVAGTLEELAHKLELDVHALTTTIGDFNDSIARDVAFDPTVKDGRAAMLTPPKSNWALPIESAPFYAFPVTCGITFTFGGLKSDTHGRVLDGDGSHIDGLYVAGEMLGGLFSGNYPGGSGLAAGAVFGRRAGAIA